jgi:NPCBM/NEW2 domain-containing protein
MPRFAAFAGPPFKGVNWTVRTGSPTWFLAIAASLLLASTAAAQSQAILADGRRMPAILVGIDAEWKIRLRGAEAVDVSAVDLVLWGIYRDVERGPQIVMNDGSLVVGDVLDIGGKEITVGDAAGLGRVLWNPSPLPRRSVRAIVYQPPADAAARDKLLDEVLQNESREDELRLVGGEVIHGTLLSGDAQRLGPQPPGAPHDDFRIAVRGRGEPLVVSAAKVQTLVLASAGGRGAAASSQGSTLVTLGLRDGSLLTCRSVRAGKSSVELELAAGGILKAAHVPIGDDSHGFWDEVTLGQPRSPRVKYLSDLETIGYKHIPFTAVEWPYGRDRNVLATRLRSGGTIHLKGLGMHSASRLAYDLDGGWKRLEAEIALDDAAGLAGSVVFKVVLQQGDQWQAAYESPVVRGGDPPLPVSVDLKQASRVALLVEYADRGDVLDHANWLNLRLVK